MTRNKKIHHSRLFCTKCGHEGIGVPRKPHGAREQGHLKKMYCIFCKEEVNHAEVTDSGRYTVADFKKEFQLGRFTEEGERVPLKDLAQCNKKDCPFYVSGKCWNANHSHWCEIRGV